jgi:anti-repressor protein
MTQLIKISKTMIGAESLNSVNSRELYVALESKQEYANWIKKQIESLGLEENFDYEVIDKNVKNPSLLGGRPSKDYIITTDTAKHIAMASRTHKGKEVRKFFIEAEKNLHVGKKQFDMVINSLRDTALEADKYKDKYYENLELMNSLLIEKLEQKPNIATNIVADANGRTLWSKDNEETIISMFRNGYKASAISQELGTTRVKVQAKLKNLKYAGRL